MTDLGLIPGEDWTMARYLPPLTGGLPRAEELLGQVACRCAGGSWHYGRKRPSCRKPDTKLGCVGGLDMSPASQLNVETPSTIPWVSFPSRTRFPVMFHLLPTKE